MSCHIPISTCISCFSQLGGEIMWPATCTTTGRTLQIDTAHPRQWLTAIRFRVPGSCQGLELARSLHAPPRCQNQSATAAPRARSCPVAHPWTALAGGLWCAAADVTEHPCEKLRQSGLAVTGCQDFFPLLLLQLHTTPSLPGSTKEETNGGKNRSTTSLAVWLPSS